MSTPRTDYATILDEFTESLRDLMDVDLKGFRTLMQGWAASIGVLTVSEFVDILVYSENETELAETFPGLDNPPEPCLHSLASFPAADSPSGELYFSGQQHREPGITGTSFLSSKTIRASISIPSSLVQDYQRARETNDEQIIASVIENAKIAAATVPDRVDEHRLSLSPRYALNLAVKSIHHNYRSLAVAPIIAGGTTLGVLRCCNKREGDQLAAQYNEGDVTLIERLGRLLGTLLWEYRKQKLLRGVQSIPRAIQAAESVKEVLHSAGRDLCVLFGYRSIRAQWTKAGFVESSEVGNLDGDQNEGLHPQSIKADGELTAVHSRSLSVPLSVPELGISGEIVVSRAIPYRFSTEEIVLLLQAVQMLQFVTLNLFRGITAFSKAFLRLITAAAHNYGGKFNSLYYSLNRIDTAYREAQPPTESYLRNFNRIMETFADFENYVMYLRGMAIAEEEDRIRVSIGELLRNLGEQLEYFTHGQRPVVSIEVDTSGIDSVQLYVAKGWLNRALENFVFNAVEATRRVEQKKLTVRISARTVKGMIQINISDDGPGLKEQNRKDIVDLLERKPSLMQVVEQSALRAAVGGRRGIGLAMSRWVIEDLHHGKLTLLSQEGRGATFRVVLPIKREV